MESCITKTIFSHKMHVRIDDINFGNHLCHSKFTNLIHQTRALFLKHHNISESNCFNTGLIILSLHIDYLNQCYFNDELEIHMNIDTIDKATLTFGYTISNLTKNKIAAKAQTKAGFIGIENGKLKRVPGELITLINNIV